MRIHEIFMGLSGEVDGFGMQGQLATFIRLQGCNLLCNWCDTQHALEIGKGFEMTVEDILSFGLLIEHIIITGGEPLLQRAELTELVHHLLRRKHFITIETNGSQDLLKLERGDSPQPYRELPRYVVDYKLGSSGMTQYMKEELFDKLTCFDVIKFVIQDSEDYHEMREVIAAHPCWMAQFAVSPIFDKEDLMWPAQLAQRLIKDGLENVKFSLQLHKLLQLQ